MDKLIINLEKENPYEVIDKGDLVEINIESNKIRKCQNKLSPYVVGVCSDEWIETDDNIPYEICGHESADYDVTNQKQESTINIQIGGLATVKTNGIVCVGDLLVSSDNGYVEAVRYKHNWENIGKVIGKCIQMTENENECIMIISNM